MKITLSSLWRYSSGTRGVIILSKLQICYCSIVTKREGWQPCPCTRRDVPFPASSSMSKPDLERARKQGLRDLRDKYALSGRQGGDSEAERRLQGKYSDRAGKRRRDVGSDHHAEKTEAASTQGGMKETRTPKDREQQVK